MDLIIVGAGAHGRIVAEAVSQGGRLKVKTFADDDPAKRGIFFGIWTVSGPWHELVGDAYCVAIGNNTVRRSIFQQLVAAGKRVPSIVSPHAYVSHGAVLGKGTVVLAGAIVQAGARIGENVIIGAGAVIDHDTTVGDHAHVGVNATVASYARVLEGELIPPGAVRLKETKPQS